jgi:serine/threonine-protein kinase
VIETPFPKVDAKWVSYRGKVVMGLVRLGEGFWSQPYGEPEWVEIPSGEFTMGSDKHDADEKPAHQRFLESFKIARVPTTNAQYLLFVQATGHPVPKHWENNRPPKGKEGHPVVQVSWHDAMAYCRWLSQVTGKQITLPTEAQWEKAARGTDGRVYPWGNEFDCLKCNSARLGIGDTTPVGIFPAGASPYGVLEMSGNIWEWTNSLFNSSYIPMATEYKRYKVLRGGSWDDREEYKRLSYRYLDSSTDKLITMGFRCVWNLG